MGDAAAYLRPQYFAQLSLSEVTDVRAQIEAFDKTLDTGRLDLGRYLTAASVKPIGTGWSW